MTEPQRTSPSQASWLATRPVFVFLALALGVSTVAMLVVRLGPAWIVDTQVPTTVMKYGPSIAGLIIAWLVGGRLAAVHLLRGLNPSRASLRWYALALGLPTLLYLLSVLAAFGGVPPVSAEDVRGFLAAFAPLLLIRMFLGGGLGEELGWRGWMLPELTRRHGVVAATLLVGVAHGLWHSPSSGIMSAAALTLLTVPWAVVFGWLYYGSGRSVLVCAIAHAAGNAWVPVIGDSFPDLESSFLVWVIGLSWLGAVPAAVWLHRNVEDDNAP